MTVKEIMSDFLGAFKAGSPAKQVTLIIETVRQLCAAYGAEVEVRLLPEPEKVGAKLDNRAIDGGVEVVFVAADPFRDGAVGVIRQILLFGPTIALIYRQTFTQLAVIAEAGVVDVGEAIFKFLRDTCDANIQVPRGTPARIADYQDLFSC